MQASIFETSSLPPPDRFHLNLYMGCTHINQIRPLCRCSTLMLCITSSTTKEKSLPTPELSRFLQRYGEVVDIRLRKTRLSIRLCPVQGSYHRTVGPYRPTNHNGRQSPLVCGGENAQPLPSLHPIDFI